MNDGFIEYRGFWAYVDCYNHINTDDFEKTYIIDYIYNFDWCWIVANTLQELQYEFYSTIDDYILNDDTEIKGW